MNRLHRATLLSLLLSVAVACSDKKAPPDDDTGDSKAVRSSADKTDTMALSIPMAARWGELCGVLIETSCIEKIVQNHNPFHCASTQDTLDAVIDLCD